MKTILRKLERVLIATLLVLLLNVVGMTKAFGQSFTEGIFNYTVNGDEVTVTGLANGTSYYGAVNIPDEVTYQETTYSVTAIAQSAFQSCTGITSVTIPSTVTSIGDCAFNGCSGLITLNYNAVNCSLGNYDYSYYVSRHWLYGCNSLVILHIGDGVETIPNYLICNCGSLTGTVAIPNSVTTIGQYAFYDCSNIDSVTIGNSVESIGSYAFGYCSNLGSVIIGSAVSTIGTYAFYYCTKLTTVVLPSSMTTINDCTFTGCSLLSSVTIPNTIVSIGNSAFMNCNKLASLTIPNSVASINEQAFCGCTSLTSVSFGNSLASIGASSFYNCTNLVSVTIPNSVVSIGNQAFYGCENVTSVTIGNNVASIGNSAFYNNSRLTSLNLGSSVVSIGNNAFYGCTSLATVAIPASVISIGVDMFGNCTKLGHITVASGNPIYDSRNNSNAIIETAANKLVAGCKNTVIPNTVVTIGERAFYSCTGLTGTLSLPNSITMIEPNAFYGCIGLSGHLNIPNSVVTIEPSAFQSCTGITSVTIPSTVTSIGDCAFNGCSGLITLNYNAVNCSLGNYDYSYYVSRHWLYGCNSLVILHIGDGVETIPNYLICNCGSLTGTVAIPNSVTTIGQYAFYDCSNIDSVTIGNSVESIGSYAFGYCSNLGSVIIGSAVSTIGTYAFYYCTKLTTVVLPSSMTTINDCTFTGCSLLSSVTIPNTIVSIGNSAFMNCNKLASLTIPNSVASINQEAFYGCSSMASITSRAVNPPAVKSNAFYNVPTNIPVEVPCNTLGDYQSATGWSSFTSIYENCTTSYEIIAMANPTTGGTVMGGDIYNQGATCTLTATANPGYNFVNWTEDNVTVSTDPVYSFTVGADRVLVANFEYTGSYANHWTPESAGYADNMAMYAVIQVDGEEQTSNQLEIGAFCGNECRGSAIATLFNVTDRYLIIMMVYGNTDDEISFRLYDHGLEQELDYIMPETVSFNVDGYGTPIEPYVLNFLTPVEITATVNPVGTGSVVGTGSYAPGSVCNLIATANTGYQFKNWTLNNVVVSTSPSYQFVVTESAEYVANFNNVHTRALVEGWNWYSTYIELEGTDGLAMLENALGNSGIRIQGRNGIVDYYEYQGNYSWYGSLTSINNEQMYKIRTSELCNVLMSGDVAETANHPITINSGWNWIGFPSGQSLSVTSAMSDFTPENEDVIKGRNSITTYLADYNMWYGTLNYLEPGHGYMYKSNSSSAKTLTFHTGSKGELMENITAENNIFTPNDAEFASNMIVTAVLNVDGEELRSEDYELAAFVGDECRGSVKLMYIEPLDRYVAFLLVYGEANEDIQFALTDGQETRWSGNTLVYSSDATVGTLSNPTAICFGVMGVNDNELVKAVVYPNPSNGIFKVKCEGMQKVEVMNIYGQIVLSKDLSADNLQIDLSENAVGVYMLRIYTDNGMVVKNLVKNN